ncbi:MAG TPA: hypothetical protein ENH33_00265 [Actinobacteria bacterium]|nr:hypothetical protein [Actinomycetota bacterium]
MRLGEQKPHRGRGLVAILFGVVLFVVGMLVAGPSTPASTASQAVVASIGIAVVFAGSLLVLLGVAHLWLVGRSMTWPRALLGAVLIASALFLGFAVFPSWWLISMQSIGPKWAKDLVSLLYVLALFAAVEHLLREPVKSGSRVSSVSAYGRTLVKRGDSGW